MTGLMESGLRRIERFSPEEQDAIRSQIIETLDDEQPGTRSFREDAEKLRRLAGSLLKSIVEVRPVRSTSSSDEVIHVAALPPDVCQPC